ncbi:MAG: hypothetical protein A2128_01760 [Candidatus Liptonbacteria bacterium GWC1_60_9]|uniref:Aminotransferase class V domain-containing protein n=3 Tax=Candidatus Liptoniibacteriota TaxID=1817909 RepID=A0A1G2CB52_9BACT|nr:MAG: Cysteine desulfurase [Parcubacteria group bacterium GW2011_GWA1_60_11]OGY97365.1 MAG: hypothetical protein A2128_01760 [Candidatus Liptonbacteria bacterium GWC1_60_9]OGY97999.1 MAG: hypothetical protein A3E09_00490 [Candidatus Liptonbacteria bacterium RIFCSPHIGHO2_12_FULL_60_13]
MKRALPENKGRIYLDYAATTPVDHAVARAMRPYFGTRFGNAGSVHSFGQEAIAALDAARERIATALGADFREVIFTGSATEANNVVLRGVVKRFRELFPERTPELVVSSIEHESVLETCRDLERDGVAVRSVPVTREGVLDMRALKAALGPGTVLVSVMHANNEIGTVQPVREIADLVRTARGVSAFPLFHTDAVQAFQYLPCDPQATGADLITISAHKLYGPKGIGVLYARRELGAKRGTGTLTITSESALQPIITGGGQEFGLRSGTENVPLIVGAAEAIIRAAALRAREARRVGELRDVFWKKIRAAWPGAQLNGSIANRLPNNLNVWFPGRRAEELLIHLDRRGIAVSSGAACSARSLTPSYVIQALGFSRERARESVRFTLGRQTTTMELDKTARVLDEIKKKKH